MNLIACPSCHTQYDVTHAATSHVDCRCGETLEVRVLEGVEASVHRCSACGAQVGAEAASCDYCGSEINRDSLRLSLICPECFARNEEAARFCCACGVGFSPEPIAQGLPELPCPVCGCLMPCRQIADVGVNECPQCNGLWVPENRFAGLLERAAKAMRESGGQISFQPKKPRVAGSNPAAQKVEYRRCPGCDALMQRKNFQKRSGVIIDVCHNHGTWLDADELEQIAGFLMKGGGVEAAAMLAARPTAAAAPVTDRSIYQGGTSISRGEFVEDRTAGGFVGVARTIFEVLEVVFK